MKKVIKLAILFLVLGLLMGVYYREATKWTNFYLTNHRTALAFVHVHLLTFGMIFTLIYGLFLNHYKKEVKDVKVFWIIYIVGVFLVSLMMVVRGSLQVFNVGLSKGIDGMIFGLAGVGHAVLAVGIIGLLCYLLKFEKNKKLE